MLEIIFKYGFVILMIIGILSSLYCIGKGTYEQKRTPFGNAIGMLFNIIVLIGFILWCW